MTVASTGSRRARIAAFAAVLVLASPGIFAFETWIERRDRGVVRQERDFSCGLAALATLLSTTGGSEVTENELLGELLGDRAHTAHRVKESASRIENGGVSFADLARLARVRGREAFGVRITPAALQRLRSPAIVALQVNGRAHFSVLRGLDENGVADLADPTWGNRRLSSIEFERAFLSGAGTALAPGTGRVLLVSTVAGGRAAASNAFSAPVPVYLAPRL